MLGTMELLEENPSTFKNIRGYFGKNARLSECLSGIDSCMKTSENFNFMDSSMRGNMCDASLGSLSSPMTIHSSYANKFYPSFNISEWGYL